MPASRPEAGDRAIETVAGGEGSAGVERATNGAGEEQTAAGDDSHTNSHLTGRTDSTGSQSDEEQVLALVEDNGGRTQQARIIVSTDWSESKVSTLLARMPEGGSVTKLRLGRENLICLNGEESELVGSFAKTEEQRRHGSELLSELREPGLDTGHERRVAPQCRQSDRKL